MSAVNCIRDKCPAIPVRRSSMLRRVAYLREDNTLALAQFNLTKVSTDMKESVFWDILIYCPIFWTLTLYLLFDYFTVARSVNSQNFVSFANATASLVSNRQNWRSIAGERDEDWLRKMNISISNVGGPLLLAHCKEVVAVCAVLQKQSQSLLYGTAQLVAIEPGVWLINVVINDQQIIIPGDQRRRLDYKLKRRQFIILFVIAVSLVLTWLKFWRFFKPKSNRG